MKLMVATFFSLSLFACGGAVEPVAAEHLSTTSEPPASIASDAGDARAPNHFAQLANGVEPPSSQCKRVASADHSACAFRAPDGGELQYASWFCSYHDGLDSPGPLGTGDDGEMPVKPGTCRHVYNEGMSVEVWCCQ